MERKTFEEILSLHQAYGEAVAKDGWHALQTWCDRKCVAYNVDRMTITATPLGDGHFSISVEATVNEGTDNGYAREEKASHDFARELWDIEPVLRDVFGDDSQEHEVKAERPAG